MIREIRSRRGLALVVPWGTLVLVVTGLAVHDRLSLAAPKVANAILRREPARRTSPRIDLDRLHPQGDGYVVDLPGGGRAELTLEPRLQREAERILGAQRAPYGAAVMLSVDDGRVLALAGRAEADPKKSLADLTLTPWAPAASVFKVVTATALVQDGVSPQSSVCYHGGVHSVEASNLRPSRRDRLCNTLAYGVAKSQNAIMARLAHEHLRPKDLQKAAQAFGFGSRLPFEAEALPSEAQVPAGGLPFARVAAGFWQTSLSPLHGAYLAATVGRGGTTPQLHLVERVVRDGESYRPAPPPSRRVIAAAAARTVGEMMVGTTEYGTARLGFHDRSGRPSLPGVAVAGKTGSLNRKPAEGPFLAYSWFVGFAPADRPEVAVAVLLGNGSGHDRRAHYLARELLTAYFQRDEARPLVAAR